MVSIVIWGTRRCRRLCCIWLCNLCRWRLCPKTFWKTCSIHLLELSRTASFRGLLYTFLLGTIRIGSAVRTIPMAVFLSARLGGAAAAVVAASWGDVVVVLFAGLGPAVAAAGGAAAGAGCVWALLLCHHGCLLYTRGAADAAKAVALGAAESAVAVWVVAHSGGKGKLLGVGPPVVGGEGRGLLGSMWRRGWAWPFVVCSAFVLGPPVMGYLSSAAGG